MESLVNRVHKEFCGVEGWGSEVKKKRCTCTLHRLDNELIQRLGVALEDGGGMTARARFSRSDGGMWKRNCIFDNELSMR